MRASARIAVAHDRKRARTRITCLRSDPPFVLRPTNVTAPVPLRGWEERGPGVARVSHVAGAAGPLGGDVFRLSIEVGVGASLILRNVAASVALPGPYGASSLSETNVSVASGGTLVWLPGAVIAARNCSHHVVTRITLEHDARLFLREETVLGRHGEQCGTIDNRLRVCVGDQPLYDQRLAIGPAMAGWDGPAVTGGRRAVGAMLLVDPGGPAVCPEAFAMKDCVAAAMPLGRGGLLVSALADNVLALRHGLDAAMTTAFGRTGHAAS